MSAALSVYKVLGLPRTRSKPSRLHLAQEIESGLPVSTLEAVAAQIAPDDRAFRFQFVRPATYARRLQTAAGNKHKARLSTDESERVVRAARVWERAMAVWQSAEAARAFLHRPHMLLGHRPPIEVVIRTDEGARVVEEILGKLQYGTAA